MPPELEPNQTVRVTGLSNREFLERYAEPGRLGLSGGITFIDRAICRAERHVDGGGKWSAWSHAFVFEGRRLDGEHWVIQSDVQVHRKHIQLGVQENRLAKYYDETLYTTLAVLDFGLTAAQTGAVLHEGLNLVANRARYSLRELLGTLLALRRPSLRAKKNLLARESSLYCSTFVRHLFRAGEVDLAPGLDLKNTTPEDLARTPVPHTTWVLQREVAQSRFGEIKQRLRRHVKAGVTLRKRRRKGQASLG